MVLVSHSYFIFHSTFNPRKRNFFGERQNRLIYFYWGLFERVCEEQIPSPEIRSQDVTREKITGTQNRNHCAISPRLEFAVKSEVNRDNFQEVPNKSRGVRTVNGKVERS